MPITTGQYQRESDFIIGIVPPRIARWGILVMFLLLAIFTLCSFIIQYPDVILSKVIVASRSQPYKISWYRNGPQVHKLYVKHNQSVHVGDTLITELNLVDSNFQAEISPLNGKVLLTHGTVENPQRSIIMVEPPDSSYDVYLDLPSKGLGNVRKGQMVLITLDAFPSAEYGKLKGQINDLIPMDFENGIRAEIKLVNGMVTTEGKKIFPQRFAQGTAEVILADKNLFQRMFGSLLTK